VDRPIHASDVEQLQKGIDIGEKKSVRADQVHRVNKSQIRMTLHQGKKRQIRRMMKTLNYQVLSLRRERFAFLNCEDMELSSWRFLNQNEVNQLKKLVELNHGD
jgi:23S rRNA pseudouridine2605 synthase